MDYLNYVLFVRYLSHLGDGVKGFFLKNEQLVRVCKNIVPNGLTNLLLQNFYSPHTTADHMTKVSLSMLSELLPIGLIDSLLLFLLLCKLRTQMT